MVHLHGSRSFGFAAFSLGTETRRREKISSQTVVFPEAEPPAMPTKIGFLFSPFSLSYCASKERSDKDFFSTDKECFLSPKSILCLRWASGILEGDCSNSGGAKAAASFSMCSLWGSNF